MASGSEKRVGLLHQQEDVLAGGEDNHHPPPPLANVGLGTDENCETGQAIADSCQALTGIAQMVKCLLSCLIKAPAWNQPVTNNLSYLRYVDHQPPPQHNQPPATAPQPREPQDQTPQSPRWKGSEGWQRHGQALNTGTSSSSG